MPRIAIIAALKREAEPLVGAAGWSRSRIVRAPYGAYEHESAIVVCAGIGANAAHRAAEEAVRAVQPALLVSVGLVGALTPDWKVAQVMVPETIVHSIEGEAVQYRAISGVPGFQPKGTLVSASGISGPKGKRLLARQYQGDAVDMEAASVAAVARAQGIPFMAVKAISDEYDFPVPDLDSFVDGDGRFNTGRFVLHAITRPSLWPVMSRLAANSARASKQLCQTLRMLLNTEHFGRADAAAPADSNT
jgi:adenosylhomocysteine nucleosidase